MNCRNLLAATLLSVVAGTSAFAADMPMPTKSYSPMSPVPVTNWSGFYAGLNAGYGWASVSSGGGSSDLTGFVGGGQIGYNWQGSSPLVLGIEADFQGSTQSRSDTVLGVTIDQKLPWFGTARARIGYAMNDWMIYATGGAAWVDYKVTGTAGGVSVSSDASKAAWTAGAGLEWMFMPKWSAKLEYLYIDSGTTTITLFGVPLSGRATDSVVRLGVNAHF